MFKEFFKKSVSVTMLRHIFLTNKYDKKQLEEQAETSKFMMHSQAMMKDYVKKTSLAASFCLKSWFWSSR